MLLISGRPCSQWVYSISRFRRHFIHLGTCTWESRPKCLAHMCDRSRHPPHYQSTGWTGWKIAAEGYIQLVQTARAILTTPCPSIAIIFNTMAPSLEEPEAVEDVLKNHAKPKPSLVAPEPEHCPGPESDTAGTADSCAGCPNQKICASAPKGPDPDIPLISQRLAGVKHRVLVLSGKGGVGSAFRPFQCNPPSSPTDNWLT